MMELYAFGMGANTNGRNVVRQDAKRWFTMRIPFFCMTLAATIIAGNNYYGNKSSGDDKYDNHSSVGEPDGYSYATGGNYTDHDNHRLLAAASSGSSYASKEIETTDIPISLLLAGNIGRYLYTAITVECSALNVGKG